MTTLTVVDGDRSENKAEAVRKRLRMEFARLDISDSEAARRAGITQDKMSRRMTGKTAFDLTDLDQLCMALGLSFNYVVTGIMPLPGGPGQNSLLPRLDSNQEPFGEWVAA